jgi:hypothetical protein
MSQGEQARDSNRPSLPSRITLRRCLARLGQHPECFGLLLRKRRGTSTAPDTVTADAPNRVWAVDFQYDVTTGGRPIKIVSIIGLGQLDPRL